LTLGAGEAPVILEFVRQTIRCCEIELSDQGHAVVEESAAAMEDVRLSRCFGSKQTRGKFSADIAFSGQHSNFDD
jgi:hypothetical protein